MVTKVSKLTLEDLFEAPKKTPAVVRELINRLDFSVINPKYCDTICKLKCKSYKDVELLNEKVDILIIQEHRNPPGKFDRGPGEQDRIQDAIIDFICKQAEFGKLKYRIISLLKCAATEEDFPSGKPPTQTTMQKCSPYFRKEIEKASPKVILSLGTSVTKSLGLPKHSNTGNRGEITLSEYGPVVITLHPRILSFIRQNARGGGGMWGADYMKVIVNDFKKAVKVATGEFVPSKTLLAETVEKIKNNQLRIARNIEDVRVFCNEILALPEEAVISFDTETTSLDPLDPNLKLLTIQFGWRDKAAGTIKAVVIPLYHRRNTGYDPNEAWGLVEPILTSARIKKVGHNVKYDILVIYWSKGVRVQGVIFDTLLMLHSIESGIQGCYGLKTACWDHLYDLGFAGYEEDLGDLSNLKPKEGTEVELEKE